MVEYVSELLSTVLYNVVFFIIFLVCFLVYRPFRAKPGTAFSEIGMSVCEAIGQIYSLEESELAGFIYLEGFLYLNFIKNCGYFLLFSTVIACLTLLPIYGKLKFSGNTELSSLSIKRNDLYDEDLIIPAMCTLILALGSFLLSYFYFMLPTAHPSLFPSVQSI
jgi:hypothetical protein